MEFSDLQQKTDKELREVLGEQRAHLRTLRFKVSERQLKQVHEITKTKKIIARILMALTKRSQTTHDDTQDA
ncbi:MAG: 50S ribosomal protein L29 [Candidatus Magasanikbacteria bacterium CG10_big_fil_rev_8_21_14_0_10_43_6]|uniref:Large ribosomal subunit protein uL29 n=1 Tax=Candidatus Magasanikbacteria bacterium CG10_big_fil_rev_8_21_14_0_10_43_6 TaxID=1974650 RepID=A0A2M6W036_9BACT|nr:MAG: 50S ribosomal protein L29 [Candidatus Magasanikbacteria bacterium CG10_big_fil_rev_8_21_14_0_10_43_6]